MVFSPLASVVLSVCEHTSSCNQGWNFIFKISQLHKNEWREVLDRKFDISQIFMFI